MTNPDHEASRPAFEAGYEPWAVKRVEEGWYEIASTESDWIEWCRALDYAASREPVAWLHILHFEPKAGDEQRLTFSPEHPFGKPGVDYSPEYEVTTIPLIATAPAASRECEWTPSKRWEHACHTACGTTFNYETQIKHCPVCGRRVKIQTTAEQ